MAKSWVKTRNRTFGLENDSSAVAELKLANPIDVFNSAKKKRKSSYPERFLRAKRKTKVGLGRERVSYDQQSSFYKSTEQWAKLREELKQRDVIDVMRKHSGTVFGRKKHLKFSAKKK